MTAILLWLLGLVLIYAEFYLPGAIMGSAGALLILASLFLFTMEYSHPLWIILYFIVVLSSIVLIIKFAIWRIPRVRSDRSIYSDDAQTGYYASTFDKDLIGQEGIVLSDLKPGGYIVIAGKQLQAISESGYISQGEKVLVLRGEGESLIVKRVGDYD